jgi:hypothetical protein
MLSVLRSRSSGMGLSVARHFPFSKRGHVGAQKSQPGSFLINAISAWQDWRGVREAFNGQHLESV